VAVFVPLVLLLIQQVWTSYTLANVQLLDSLPAGLGLPWVTGEWSRQLGIMLSVTTCRASLSW
jgi:hypothetical protein